MVQFFWSNMPELDFLQKSLQPWGDVVVLRGQTLRLTPFDEGYPTMFFNRGGSIDILIPENDLFYQHDCLEILKQWLGESVND